jgi:hypothetical protein
LNVVYLLDKVTALQGKGPTRVIGAKYGKPDAVKVARPVCAVRRVVVSLLQAGGTEERFLGYWHIWRRKLKETKHAREAVHV